MAQITAVMRTQMKTHRTYLINCVGWTAEEVDVLIKEYEEAMQTPEGEAAITAHLASVAPIEAEYLATFYRRAS